MAFTPEEKANIRYHLGYPNVEPVSGYGLGIPIPLQTSFILESTMDRVIAVFEPKIRELLEVLDGIECNMVKAQKRLSANRVGDIELRQTEISQLEAEHSRWAKRLADCLCAPIYPFSTKFAGTRAGNIPVSG